MAPLCGPWQVRDSQPRDDVGNASLRFSQQFARAHDFLALQRPGVLQSSCQVQKPLNFKLKLTRRYLKRCIIRISL